MKFLTKSLITAVIILSSWNSITAQSFSNGDTLFPSAIITPFNADLTDPVNFPIQNAEFIGDINGDGLGDFVVEKFGADETTPDLTDQIRKSAIITDINSPKSAYVLRNASVKGIGDYNGDGFDDMVDVQSGVILLGNSSGRDFEEIPIALPEEFQHVYFYGDVNNDGNSDFLLGEENYCDSLMVYSIIHEQPVTIKTMSSSYDFNEIESLFQVYDFDGDDTLELCIANFDIFSVRFGIVWYSYDSMTNKYIQELYKTIHTDHAQHNSVSAFSDINGDGLKDLCHAFWGEGGMHIEACLASETSANYFNDPIEIIANNPTRFLYSCGDFNNDGAEDWYSKSSQDTIVLYYGNADIENQGFVIQKYYTGEDVLTMPLAHFLSIVIVQKILDYNHDGISDIYVNYWKYDEYKQYETIGTAIYLGSSQPDISSPLIMGTPQVTSFDQLGFGSTIRNIGDFNKDGYEDWAILYRFASRANIYFGSEVLNSEPDIQILLPQDPNTECLDISVGDLNGDGLSDIVISNSSDYSPLTKSLLNEKENIFVFLGKPDFQPILSDQNADYLLESYGVFSYFGNSLSIVGDYNADGYQDIVVAGGANLYLDRRAYVYFGGEQLSTEPDMQIKMWNSGSTFANPITACGDINSDGFDDFVLANPGYEQGRSLVYFGGPQADSLFDVAIENPYSTFQSFGSITPRFQGDYTGDGYPDLVYVYGINGFVCKGGPDFDNQIDYTYMDSTIYIAESIEYVQDFTNKGRSDILVSDNSDEGNLFLFLGGELDKTKADLLLKTGLPRTSGIASGDFNNDDYTDILIGNPLEPNYGNRYGGLVSQFISPNYVDITESGTLKSNELTVFPNPASSQVNLILNSDKQEIIIINILNVNGQSVYQTRGMANQELVLNLEDLPIGIYVVQAVSGSKTIQKKLLKLAD